MTGAEISRVSVNSKRRNSVSGQENTGLVFGMGDAFFASSLPFFAFPCFANGGILDGQAMTG